VQLADFVGLDALGAFASVVIIDVTLAGDNAVIVGMAASGLPRDQQQRVIMIGIIAATVLRIVFAVAAVHLLGIIGLTLAGGILLLWVVWKTYRELVQSHGSGQTEDGSAPPPGKTFGQAVFRIVLADVSMSLDNILAVAGTAREHFWVLVAGLFLSVALMGAASTMMARLLDRHSWIAWIGLAIVAAVALRVI
jgi:YjbE family integral membrane protein